MKIALKAYESVKIPVDVPSGKFKLYVSNPSDTLLWIDTDEEAVGAGIALAPTKTMIFDRPVFVTCKQSRQVNYVVME